MLSNIQDKTKSTIIRKACPYCGKLAHENSFSISGTKKKVKLDCGHTIVTYLEDTFKKWSCESLMGKRPFPYQYKTLDFIINSNFRTGIFHQQRVGKTVCALMAVKRFPEKLMPFAVVCKGSLRAQWFKEILDWTGQPAQIIVNGNDKPFPGIFKAFILSYDLLRNKDLFKDLNLQLVILDECQQIKNSQTKRTQALRLAVRDIPYVMALSGTPIKNHAGEYFPILNILRPDRFASETQFERDFLDSYFTGYSYKVGGINRHQTDRFKELTQDFTIRYMRDDVLPDLPKTFRSNFFVELGQEVEQAYKKAYIEFQEEYQSGNNEFGDTSNLLAKLNRLRHITGLAKVLPVTEYVEEFLEDNDRKIVLFVHHQNVGLGLYNNILNVTKKLGLHAPLMLTSANAGSDEGNRIDEAFKTDPNKRIMIASTLSAGEGKNWQMCSDLIMVELQWNPANEEQAEDRFPGIGTTANKINATYAIALGTPDEFLTEIKERKREICRKTMGNEAVQWNQTSVIKEMAELLFAKGGKKWGL